MGRTYIIKFVLYSSLVLTVLFCLLLVISFSLVQNNYVYPRLLLGLAMLVYFSIGAALLRAGFVKSTGYMILAAYLLIALSTAWFWGMNAPVSVLLLTFVILLSSVMFGPRYTLPTAALISSCLVFIQIAVIHKLSTPQTESLSNTSTFADVAVYSIIFGVFAIVGWLSSTQLYKSIEATEKAKDALKKEKEGVEATLKLEKAKLRLAQDEERLRLYEFAELGQYTTMVLHDLANQVTTLSLSINDKSGEEKVPRHITQTMDRIEELIQTSNRRISRGAIAKFHPSSVIDETIRLLKNTADKNKIRLIKRTDSKTQSCLIYGDPDRLGHIINILVSNAIQASAAQGGHRRNVTIYAKVEENFMTVAIRNKGTKIHAKNQGNIFKPFTTTKINGHGIGLYIARKVTEDHFRGNINLSPRTDLTEFVITLPLYK